MLKEYTYSRVLQYHSRVTTKRTAYNKLQQIVCQHHRHSDHTSQHTACDVHKPPAPWPAASLRIMIHLSGPSTGNWVNGTGNLDTRHLTVRLWNYLNQIETNCSNHSRKMSHSRWPPPMKGIQCLRRQLIGSWNLLDVWPVERHLNGGKIR
jgi:hypothetical protein